MISMRNKLLWLILAIIGVALVLLVWNDKAGETFGIDNDQFGGSVYFAVWGLVIAAGLFGMHRRIGHVARNLALWLVVLFVLVAGYQYRFDLQDFASRVTAGLVPGSPVSSIGRDGRASVTLDKFDNGHFGARASVDGVTIPMIIDTGATTTVLTARDAERVGIDTKRLSYSVAVTTANGRTKAALAEARTIAVGDILRRHVQVLVTPAGSLDQSLLGMNFIGSLSSFEVRGGRMILRD
jgi:aspartyl protease family protein